MAVSRGQKLPGTGGVLQRLCESRLSEMLRKELDHIASKWGLPTLALCDFPSVQTLWRSSNHASPFTPPHTSPVDTGLSSIKIRFPPFYFPKCSHRGRQPIDGYPGGNPQKEKGRKKRKQFDLWVLPFPCHCSDKPSS